MTQAAYIPMHGPQKEVSEQRMQEILARHSQPKVEAPAQTGPEIQESQDKKAGVLVWEKISDYYMRSACGRYRCRKYYPGDVLNDPGKVRYQLERIVEGMWFYRFGPPQGSWAEAKKLAEADAQKDSEKP